MGARRARDFIWTILVLLASGGSLHAQTGLDELRARLVGQPLYLRGFWMDPNLEFDSEGRLMGTARQWPFTLSGIDVTSLSAQGKLLVIQANRVALVTNAAGVMERRNLSSTTRIWPSLRRGDGNKFIAKLEVKLIVHAGEDGSFDRALHAIFANGFEELAQIVPPYWSCYAEGYFSAKADAGHAEEIVTECVKRKSLSGDEAARHRGKPGFTEVEIVNLVRAPFSQMAASVGVDGVSHVRFTVSQHGIPVGFQVVRAVGAGMDEGNLEAVSESKFQPAMLDGVPVAADIDVNVTYHAAH